MSINATFAGRFLALCGNKTQEEVAKAIGVQRAAVGHYQTGVRLPGAKTLACIAQYFGVSADYLLGLTDAPTTDADLRAVCDYTGLSEGAVEGLAALKASELDSRALVMLSYFLEDGRGSDLFTALLAYIDSRLNDLEYSQLREVSTDEQLAAMEDLRAEVLLKSAVAYMTIIPTNVAAKTLLELACDELKKHMTEYVDKIVEYAPLLGQAAARSEGGTDDGDD